MYLPLSEEAKTKLLNCQTCRQLSFHSDKAKSQTISTIGWCISTPFRRSPNQSSPTKLTAKNSFNTPDITTQSDHIIYILSNALCFYICKFIGRNDTHARTHTHTRTHTKASFREQRNTDVAGTDCFTNVTCHFCCWPLFLFKLLKVHSLSTLFSELPTETAASWRSSPFSLHHVCLWKPSTK